MVERLGHSHKVLSIKPTQDWCIEIDRGEYMPASYNLDDVKPYLRPMESMTENEYDEWLAVSNDGGWGVTEGLIAQCADRLNARHFDYRGLIPKNLAIAVTKENNPYK